MAQERAESILASINNGLVVLDADWPFAYANAAAERILSCAAADLIGKTHWEPIPRYGWYGLGSRLQPRHEGAKSASRSRLYEAVEALEYPARDGGLSIYFQDATERKRSEEALHRLMKRWSGIIERRKPACAPFRNELRISGPAGLGRHPARCQCQHHCPALAQSWKT